MLPTLPRIRQDPQDSQDSAAEKGGIGAKVQAAGLQSVRCDNI